jgi:hypothetical protein
MGDRTRVAVVIRHGRLLVSFTWLLWALAVVASVAPRGGGRPGEVSPVVGVAVFAAFGVLWYVRLWRDLRQVRREIVALLTDEAADGPPNRALHLSGGA